MLRLFHNNHFINSLLLLPITVIMHFSLFWGNQAEPQMASGILGYWLMQAFSGAPFWSACFTVLLLFFQAILLNRMVIIHRMSSEITLTPGLLWIIMTALHPQMQGLQSALVSVLFVILGIHSVFYSYKKVKARIHLFNAAFWFSVASLVYAPASILFVFGLIALNHIRSLRPIDVRQYITSWMIPYFLIACAAYLWDDLQTAIYIQWYDGWDFFALAPITDSNQYIVWGILILLSVVSLLSSGTYTSKKIIYAQKKIGVIYLYFFMACMVFLLVNRMSLAVFVFSLWPLAYFLSETFLIMRNRALSELFALILLVIALYAQFQYMYET